MSLRISLQHAYPGAVLDMDIEAPSHGITALFGPSGAGKSSVIAAVAGLLRPDRFHIEIDGQVLADTASRVWEPPERRRIGLVFQDARLFPHMSVASHLRFGLRRAPPGPIQFDAVVELLGIGRLLARRPHMLSGGERQRVAIGRALLAQPRLLLMDEPLASLDADRKAEILPYLADLNATLRLPILYVTHALDEVAHLADEIVLIDSGRVLAAGKLSEIVARANLPLALRDDAAALLAFRVARHDVGRRLTVLEAGGATLLIPLIEAEPGSTLRVRILAKEVILARPGAQGLNEATSLNNVLLGTVRAVGEDRARHAALVEVALGHGALLSRITPDAVGRLELAPGTPVLALMKSTSIEVLGPDRGTVW